MEIDQRFVFAGHAIGASAHFHRLDNLENLDHAIPTLGSSVVPPVGGLSHHKVSDFCLSVNEPRKRTLLSAQHAEAIARGKEHPDRWETHIDVKVRGVSVLEKFHVDTVQFFQVATRARNAATSQIITKAVKLDGLRLGSVTATVHMDPMPFEKFGTKQQLLDFLNDPRNSEYREANAWRFTELNGRLFATFVTKIELSGPPEELSAITVTGNMIRWVGFGRIYLGEVIIRDEDRRVTMVRLKMGSDGGGVGTIGDGHTNGGTVP